MADQLANAESASHFGLARLPMKLSLRADSTASHLRFFVGLLAFLFVGLFLVERAFD